jgi:hypothetical protein
VSPFSGMRSREQSSGSMLRPLPLWGKVQAQEMVEHLVWAFELSNGEARTDCSIPAGELPRTRRFLHSNRPAPQDVMNPALVAGLPALRYGALADESSLSH